MKSFKYKLWRLAIGYSSGGIITDKDGTWVSVFKTKLYINTKPISYTWKV